MPLPPFASPKGPIQQVRFLIKSMRPRQWTKNLPVFAGVVFAGQLFTVAGFIRASIAFVVFCLLSSGIYLINDLADLENDRQHPTKCKRPLAAGLLSLPIAWVAVLVLFSVALPFAFLLDRFAAPVTTTSSKFHLFGVIFQPALLGISLEPYSFGFVALGYILLQIAYTFKLKHIVLLDVFSIAIGFVLRAVGGAVAIPVPISPWLLLCTILLALFLGLSKRRHELVLLDDKATDHRQILREYTPQMLDQMIMIVTATTVMAYSLYTFQGPSGSPALMFTIPLVLYGIFRYLYLVHLKNQGGSPDEVLLKDKPMLITVSLCSLMIIVILYAVR